MHTSDPVKRTPHPAPTRYLTTGILVLVGIEIGLAIAYLTSSLLYGSSPEILDFNGRQTLPSLLQAGQLFLIGAIALWLLMVKRQLKHRLSIPLLIGIALLCGFGGLDELFKIHLTAKQIPWKGLYLSILTAIPILCWKDLRMLWRSHRGLLVWVGVGISVFVLGGFGAEFLKDGLKTFMEEHTATETTVFAIEHLRITIEELAELIGETTIVYAVGKLTLQLFNAYHQTD
jgi:hypothetical protein